MIRYNVFLEEEQIADLRKLAKKQRTKTDKVTVASSIRAAIDMYLLAWAHQEKNK